MIIINNDAAVRGDPSFLFAGPRLPRSSVDDRWRRRDNDDAVDVRCSFVGSRPWSSESNHQNSKWTWHISFLISCFGDETIVSIYCTVYSINRLGRLALSWSSNLCKAVQYCTLSLTGLRGIKWLGLQNNQLLYCNSLGCN